MAHAFARGIGAGFLLFCFCVGRYDAGPVFAFFSASIHFGQRCSGVLLSAVCTFECQLFVVLALVGVMSSCMSWHGGRTYGN